MRSLVVGSLDRMAWRRHYSGGSKNERVELVGFVLYSKKSHSQW